MDEGLIQACGQVAHPPTLTKICRPKDLTDTEKAIYLKLVESAKAGKITWEGSKYGKYGDFRVTVDNTSTCLSKVTNDMVHTVAYIEHGRGQIAGDLYELAKEQWAEQQATMTAEFLQA